MYGYELWLKIKEIQSKIKQYLMVQQHIIFCTYLPKNYYMCQMIAVRKRHSLLLFA